MSEAVGAPAPIANATTAPAPPDGWRALFPFPPAAPTSAWSYHPNAAIIARAELTDARLGLRFTREVSVMIPLSSGTLDLDRATTFEHEGLEKHAPVPGARFVPYADAPIPARALRSMEKALKEQAIAALRTPVMINDELELVSQPGETPQAFAERCTQTSHALAVKTRNELLVKHEPKIGKLAAERDQAHRATGMVTNARDRQRAQKDLGLAQAALDEAVRKRDQELVAKEQAILAAPGHTKTKEIGPKKDALVIEAFALVWIAG